MSGPAGYDVLGFLPHLGPMEILLILFLALLLFGRRLPDAAKSLGAGLKEFKKGLRDGATEEESKPGKVIDAPADAGEKPKDASGGKMNLPGEKK
ncbi:MAG: twin-arginine translocase TatA/TatE family subunit [Planctomycetes bacterium]|nr:twin-arginine translocase TatA/TatE family subunit [Planctomycetota bacterium]